MLEVGQSVCGAPAIDAKGNIWLADQPQVNELNPNGVLVRQLVFDGAVFLASAVDGEGNVWLGNATPGQSAEIELNSVGKQIYATPFNPNDTRTPDPQSLAVDGDGNVWAADLNGGVTKITTSTSPFAVNDYPSGGINATSLAVDRDNHIWVANLGGGPSMPPNVTELNPSGTQIGPSLMSALLDEPQHIAVDTAGKVWVGTIPGVTEINLSTDPPTLTDRTGGGIEGLGIAIDGSNHIWVMSDAFDRLVELDASGARVADAAFDVGGEPPDFIAIDAVGNIWTTGVLRPDLTDCKITKLIGPATPVKTPLIGPPVKP
jgi:ligand-binding sensor domain-containing protein